MNSSTSLAVFTDSTSSRKNISIAFLSRGNNFFLPRAEAEINPAYKQIIPYALIAFQNKVAYYVRGKKAGEQRLVAKGSIGIGGHMNESRRISFCHG